MKTAKTILLVLLSVLLLLNTWIWLTGTLIQRTVLNERFYERLLERTDLPDAVQDKFLFYMTEPIAREIGSSLPYEIGPTGLQTLNKLYGDALLQSMGRDWVESQAVRFIAGTLRYWKGEDRTIDVSLSLDGREADVLAQLPLSFAQLSEQEQKFLSGPEQYDGLLMTRLQEGFVLPDAQEVFNNTSMPDFSWVVDAYPHEAALARTIWQIAPYAVGFILMLSILLIARMNRGSKWIGSTLVASGVSFFLITLPARIFLIPVARRISDKHFSTYFGPMVPDVVRLVFIRAAALSLVVLTAGILVLGIRWLIVGRNAKHGEPLSPPA